MQLSRRAFIALLLCGCSVGRSECMKCSIVGLLGFGATAQWYVDSVTGNDANGGHSPSDALATLGTLVAKPVRGGETVWLARGSVWREELTALPQHIAVRAYGAGARPIIDGRNIAAGGSWTKTVGRTNIYQISWAHGFGSAVVSGQNVAHRVWQDGTMMPRVATQETLLATALTELDTTPGAFWAAAPTNGTDTVYIHATGADKNPATNGKQYQLTQREYCVNLRAYRNHARLYSLHCIGNAHAAGAISYDGYSSDCVSTDGRVHNFFVRGVCEDAFANGIEVGAVFGDATMFVTYDDSGSATAEIGRNTIYRRCIAQAGTDQIGPTGGHNYDFCIGFYCHTDAAPGFNFGTIYYEDCEATGVTLGFSGANVDKLVYYKCGGDAQYAYQGYSADDLIILGGTTVTIRTGACLLLHSDDFEVPDNIVLRGVRWAGNASGALPLTINIDGTTVEVSRCTIASSLAGGGGTNWLRDGTFNIYENIFHGAFIKVGQTSEALPSYTANRNVYWFWDGASFYGANFQHGDAPPIDFIGLAAWQAEMGQDSNSVVGDPLFTGDPIAGVFTVQAASPANARHAGADYEGEDNDAVLQALLLQYTAGLQT